MVGYRKWYRQVITWPVASNGESGENQRATRIMGFIDQKVIDWS
jgi:hypothetical protein